MTPPLEKWLAEMGETLRLSEREKLLVKLLRKALEQRDYVIINCRGGLDDRSEAMEKGDAALTQIISDTLGEK